MKFYKYFATSYLILVCVMALAVSATGKTLDTERETGVILEEVANISAYNVRMTLRINDEILATPSLTMIAGKGTLVAKGHTKDNPYKLTVTLLDDPEIHTRFPQLKLQSSFENLVFVETGLYMPEFRDQPSEQWRKIASPSMILRTDGKQSRIKSDASSLNFHTMTSQNKHKLLVREIALEISAFPTQVTQQQIDRAKNRKSNCTGKNTTDQLSRGAGTFAGLEEGSCCTDGCLTCCWGGPGVLCCSDQTLCPGGGCCI